MEVHITEIFTGDMDGNSTVRALQIERQGKSASMVSMQRFSGQIGGRRGTFVLQGSEVVENGRIKATWSVVPGSGTRYFPDCVVRADLKVRLERDPMGG